MINRRKFFRALTGAGLLAPSPKPKPAIIGLPEQLLWALWMDDVHGPPGTHCQWKNRSPMPEPGLFPLQYRSERDYTSFKSAGELMEGCNRTGPTTGPCRPKTV